MAYAGIDYGMGRTNVDRANGIRYGVISQHSVMQAWCDSAEPDYGPATCPKCGNEAIAHDAYEGDTTDFEHAHGCADYVCVSCESLFDSQDAYGDDPQSWSYDGEGYQLTDCLDSDIMVLKAPYYTFAQFCSPCVPGAGNLDGAEDYNDLSPGGDLPRTYCLGHDWFEGGWAPYRVYSVETDQEVTP